MVEFPAIQYAGLSQAEFQATEKWVNEETTWAQDISMAHA